MKLAKQSIVLIATISKSGKTKLFLASSTAETRNAGGELASYAKKASFTHYIEKKLTQKEIKRKEKGEKHKIINIKFKIWDI